MDAVILAGGKGSRLEGVMPPYFKPLMIVSGQPLIASIAKRTETALRTGQVVIVSAPENTLPIVQVMGHTSVDYELVVQPSPNGPGDALYRGLQLCRSEYVLVLMGDNVTTYADLTRMIDNSERNAIGVSLLEPDTAESFTRRRKDGQWVEKIPITDDDIVEHGMVLAWIGPIVVNRAEMIEAIENSSRTRDVPIGPFFNDLSDVHTIAVSSIDIGTPERLP